MRFWISILLTIFLLTSCDLFIPREPDPPIKTPNPYAWKPPTTPEIVLDNLSNAFPASKKNYYLDVLSHNLDTGNGFVFLPDPGVASSQPGVFDAWGYDAEETFITKLFQSLDASGLQRLTWQTDQVSPIDNYYEIIADYQITLTYSENSAAFPVLLGGQATLTLTQNSDLLYEVSQWEDLKSDSLQCWTELKALIQ